MQTRDPRRSTLTEGQIWCAPDLGILDILEDVLSTSIRVVGVIHEGDGPVYDETAGHEHLLAQLFLIKAELLQRLLGNYRNSIIRRLNEPTEPFPF